MSTQEIKTIYADLRQAQQQFIDFSQSVTTLQNHLSQRRVALNGEWIGHGSSSFMEEMDLDIIPALGRLSQAMGSFEQFLADASLQLEEVEREGAASIDRLNQAQSSRPDGRDAIGDFPDGSSVEDHRLPPDGMSNHNILTAEGLETVQGVHDNDTLKIPNLNITEELISSNATSWPSNMADLYTIFHEMYTEYDDVYKQGELGVDEPIKIVQVGQDNYAVFVNGTDFGTDGNISGNDWFANLSTGRGVPSKYQLYVQELISDHIPQGSNINLIGHSQGGHVVMNLGDTQSLADQYNIENVISFGASGSTSINHHINPNQYFNYLLGADPIRILEDTTYLPKLNPFSIFNFAGIPGSGWSPSIDPIVINEFKGHLDYADSTHLQNTELPFAIEQWNEIGSFEAASDTFQNSRLGYEVLSDPFMLQTGLMQIAEDYLVTSSFAITENILNSTTTYLPTEWQREIDRGMDFWGEQIANRPPMIPILPIPLMLASFSSVISGNKYNPLNPFTYINKQAE